MPLLLLLLGASPPVTVKGDGRRSIHEAIALHLQSVLDRVEHDNELACAPLLERVPGVVAWISWRQLGEVVTGQAGGFAAGDPTLTGTVHRLAQSISRAIDRHS